MSFEFLIGIGFASAAGFFSYWFISGIKKKLNDRLDRRRRRRGAYKKLDGDDSWRNVSTVRMRNSPSSKKGRYQELKKAYENMFIDL